LALYQVPNLVGDDLITAERVLIEDGLTIGLITEQESDQSAGTVVQTNPEANTAVLSGTAINFVVAV
jgi:beta-lactam-binding protein with PASTA domain